ncbi:MAG TPA: 4-hydroxythreonine-4-phosphate dehydrogenase PdxA, partial [Cellvibrionaceae bacterium]|nr:4-hydroxythreonine-4-phosphate dehydrogenase PdxA [Cellvibrionaceae bacterium]
MRIAITPGEPAGIGPELIVRYCQTPATTPCELVVFADGELLQQTAAQLNVPLTLNAFNPAEQRLSSPGELSLVDIKCAAPVTPSQLNTANAQYVLTTLAAAQDACIKGECDAL